MSFADSILVIDDDPAIACVVTDAPRRTTRSVRRAVTGAEGLAAVREDPPELIVLDLGLPDLDRLAVCRPLSDPSAVVPCRLGRRLWRCATESPRAHYSPSPQDRARPGDASHHH
jgi:DNA-binding NtrC family response regulator